MSSLNKFSTEVYSHQLSKTKKELETSLTWNLMMIYDGKKKCKPMEDCHTLWRLRKVTSCPVSFKDGYQCLLICSSKSSSWVELKLSVRCCVQQELPCSKRTFPTELHSQSILREQPAGLSSWLEGYHSVDFIYKVGSVPVYPSEVIHIWRIVHLDFMAKSSVFRVGITVPFFTNHLPGKKS